jgi:leucyl-tRNA synthetase
VWRLINETPLTDEDLASETAHVLHTTIKKVTEDIETLDLNTAISQLMICTNTLGKLEKLPRIAAEGLLKLLSPFAPHLCEELWSHLGHPESIAFEDWPAYEAKYLVKDDMTIAIQVNGKLRSRISVPKESDKETILNQAKADTKIQKYLEGKELVKEIYVPGRLVNLVLSIIIHNIYYTAFFNWLLKVSSFSLDPMTMIF